MLLVYEVEKSAVGTARATYLDQATSHFAGMLTPMFTMCNQALAVDRMPSYATIPRPSFLFLMVIRLPAT